MAELAVGLSALNFAGAVVVNETLQREAFKVAERSSLDAQTAKRADTLTVTAAGLMADYTWGRALGSALHTEGWDVRGAEVVMLGAGAQVAAMAQELASLGAKRLSLLAKDRPAAEQSLPALAASTEAKAGAFTPALARPLLESADLLVRTDARLSVDRAYFGPHLNVIDLAPAPLTDLRKLALSVGAKSLGLRDLQAHRMALVLGQVLGERLDLEPFLTAFHSGD